MIKIQRKFAFEKFAQMINSTKKWSADRDRIHCLKFAKTQNVMKSWKKLLLDGFQWIFEEILRAIKICLHKLQVAFYDHTTVVIHQISVFLKPDDQKSLTSRAKIV